jgi:hypothetical protein
MVIRRRVGVAVMAVLCAAGIVSCGGAGRSVSRSTSAASAASAAPPDVVNGCAATHAGWQSVPGTVAAAAVGSGPAVVFANDSGNEVCDWLPVAEQLAAAGHRVAVFQYSGTSAQAEADALSDTLAVANAVRGGGRYVLVGASLGGRIVIEAAAERPAGLAGIVSLSGERTVQDYRDILPDARRVRTAALYVGATEDSLTDGLRQPQQLHAAMRGVPNELLQVDGYDHGVDLLETQTTDGRSVGAHIVAFVRLRLAG